MHRELKAFSRGRLLTENKVSASLTTIIGVDDPTTSVSIFGKNGWMVKLLINIFRLISILFLLISKLFIGSVCW
jgi:hypothetical protein